METARGRLAQEGILTGISAGTVWAPCNCRTGPENEGQNHRVCHCDTGERYLSTELFASARRKRR